MKELILSPDNLSFLFPTPAYGPYRVTRDLGDGRAGRTCLAEHVSGRTVVVRGFDVALPEAGRDPLARFLDQLASLGLDHPSLSEPLTSGETDGTLWIAHRYLPGTPLDTAGAPALAAEAVARLLEPVAAALDHAAGAGVVHGDLTPRDIICRDGRGALAGVGIVQALGAAGLALTGLPPWASPQRRQGALPTHADDVYALAAIAAGLLGVDAARLGTSAEADARADDESSPVAPRVLAVLGRGLAEDPDERPVSALSFTALLFTAATAAAHRAIQADAGERQLERNAATAAEVPYVQPQRQVEEDAGEQGLALSFAPPDSREPDVEPELEPELGHELEPELEPALKPEFEPELEPQPQLEPELIRDVLPPVDAEPEPVADVAMHADAPTWSEPVFESAPLHASVEPPSTPATAPHEPDGAEVLPPIPSRWPGVLAALIVGLAVGLGSGYLLWHGATSREASSSRAAAAPATPAQPSAPADAPTAVPTGGSGAGERASNGTDRPDVPPLVPSPAPSLVPSAPASGGSPVAAAPSPARAPARPTPAAPRAQRQGTLSVRTVPDGARVLIDGDARGRSPLVLRDVRPGSHVVTVERDGYLTERRRVTVRAEQTGAPLQFRLRRQTAAATASSGVPASGPGRLQVESRPAGARVFLDGALVGTTPLVLPDVRPGRHDVRLELGGYRPWTSAAEVTAGERVRVAASLDR